MFQSLRGIILGIAILNCGVALAAESSSANRVMPGCREFIQDGPPRGIYLQGVCAGMINAIFYYSRRFNVCIPTGANVGQTARIVVQYIDRLPARHHEDFLPLAVEALHNAWPCKP